MESSDDTVDHPDVDSSGSSSAVGGSISEPSSTERNISQYSLSPALSRKFQFLVAVLKDIQSNVQEMDSMIQMQGASPRPSQNEDTSSSHNIYTKDTQNLKALDTCIDSSKTDEAKLNEILSLLHNITDALSSYEQIPLLAESCKTPAENDKVTYEGPGVIRVAGATSRPPIATSDSLMCAATQTDIEDNCLTAAQVDASDTKDTSSYQHHFSQETKSLRHEIDAAIKRKDALDKKLQILFAQRGQVSQHDTLDCYNELSRHNWQVESKNSKTDKTYHDDAFVHAAEPCVNVTENMESIEDLRHDEEQVLGLAESGLSGEINSLHNTIQQIIKQNQQYQAFFQGISSEANKTRKHGDLVKGEGTERKKRKREFLNMEKSVNISTPVTAENPEELVSPNFTEERTALPSEKFPTIVDNSSILKQEKIPEIDSHVMAAIHADIDSRLKFVLEAQENAIEVIIKEKRDSDSKCLKLEKMVEELIRINEENKLKYGKEIHVLDVENCKLKDELKKEDEISTDSPQAQSNEISTDNPQEQTNEISGCSDFHLVETHSICQAHIEKLSREKEMLLLELDRARHRDKLATQKHKLSTSSLHLQSSSSNTYKDADGCTKCSSLPVCRPSSGEDVHTTEISNAETTSLDDELFTLKSRVKFLENYLKRQYSSDNENIKSSPKENLLHNCSGDSSYGTAGLANNLDREPVLSSKPKKSTRSPVNLPDRETLYQRIIVLMEEKEILSNRLEELLSFTREVTLLYKTARLELMKLKNQQEKPKLSSASISCDDRSHSLTLPDNASERELSSQKAETESSDSTETRRNIDDKEAQIGNEMREGVDTLNSNLNEQCNSNAQLYDEIRRLQIQVERAVKEAREKSLQIERLTAEKEKFGHFLTSNLSSAEQENLRLQAIVKALREENAVLCSEFKSYRNSMEETNCEETAPQHSSDCEKKGSEGNEETVAKTDVNERVEAADADAVVDGQTEKETDAHARWQESLAYLQRCLMEEKLQSQLLSAAEMENSARVAVLQQAVKQRGDMYQILLVKYQKLRQILSSRKAERRSHKEIFRECSQKMEELSSTTAAIEGNYKVQDDAQRCLVTSGLVLYPKEVDHIVSAASGLQYTCISLGLCHRMLYHHTGGYDCSWFHGAFRYRGSPVTKIHSFKVMLSTLGHNIGIAVELLSSHLYFVPSQVHPSPELSADPAFWFAAQCSRLRWLQAQLRKLCLYTWKSDIGLVMKDKRKYQNKNNKKANVSDCLSSELLDKSFVEDCGKNAPLMNQIPEKPDEGLEKDLMSSLLCDSDGGENGTRRRNLADCALMQSVAVNSSIWSSLSEAEIVLTNEQVKLAEAKSNQFNHLVNILKQNCDHTSRKTVVESSLDHHKRHTNKTNKDERVIDELSSIITSSVTDEVAFNKTEDISLVEESSHSSNTLPKGEPSGTDKRHSLDPLTPSLPNDTEADLEVEQSGAKETKQHIKENSSQNIDLLATCPEQPSLEHKIAGKPCSGNAEQLTGTKKQCLIVNQTSVTVHRTDT